jgi:predicted PurR-regulated permease PerM
MKSWRKIVLCSGTVLPVIFACTTGFAQTFQQNASPSSQNWANSPQNWKNNPDNWQNSSQNWQNSAQNWKNSPQNWQNSASNYNNSNGIFDSKGNRVGYSVPTANGGVNYFNNDGSRRGYQPGQ